MSGKNTVNEKPLRSTPGDFDRFINSSLWYDMRGLIKDRLELLQEQFLMAESIEEIRNLQGQMKAWKEMLGIPPYLKSCAHKEKPIKQEELSYE